MMEFTISKVYIIFNLLPIFNKHYEFNSFKSKSNKSIFYSAFI